MSGKDSLVARFEANRSHLRSVAYRMLGSRADADDAVQRSFLRISRSDSSSIDNISGWFTTVVARVCLDMLRERKSRREVPLDSTVEAIPDADDPEHRKLVADSVGFALLVVLESLTPTERVAFVLHDVFDIPFDAIAVVIGRSPAAARQSASRGRRRVQGAGGDAEADAARQRELVGAFLAASQSGDYGALLTILDPGVVLRADATAVAASLRQGSGDMPALAPETRGRELVANIFRGRARNAQLVFLDGDAALAFVPGGQPRLLIDFVVVDDRIAEISMIANSASIAALGAVV